MKKQSIPYEKQIFVCTNDNKGEGASCGDQCGEQVFRALRNKAKEKGIHPRIRVTQAKCLGKCNEGCSIMIYPNEIYYSHVTLRDIDNLVEQLFE